MKSLTADHKGNLATQGGKSRESAEHTHICDKDNSGVGSGAVIPAQGQGYFRIKHQENKKLIETHDKPETKKKKTIF